MRNMYKLQPVQTANHSLPITDEQITFLKGNTCVSVEELLTDVFETESDALQDAWDFGCAFFDADDYISGIPDEDTDRLGAITWIAIEFTPTQVRVTNGGATWYGPIINADNYGSAEDTDWYLEFTNQYGVYMSIAEKRDQLKSIKFS